MDNGDLGTTAAIAAVLVPIISMLKRPTWSSRVNFVIGMVASFIAAIAGTLIDNQGDWKQLVPQFGAALATTQIVYNLYFASTGLNNRLTDFGA